MLCCILDVESKMYSMPHRGLFVRGFRASHSGEAGIGKAMDYGIRLVYWSSPLPQTPVTDGILSKAERNNQVRNTYQNGVSVATPSRNLIYPLTMETPLPHDSFPRE